MMITKVPVQKLSPWTYAVLLMSFYHSDWGSSKRARYTPQAQLARPRLQDLPPISSLDNVQDGERTILSSP